LGISIKIKSYTIFLAWLVIFGHSIIPHSHIQEDACESKYLIHNANRIGGIETKDLSISNPVSDGDKVCHFNNNLFPQQNYEDLLLTSENKRLGNNPIETSVSLYFDRDPEIPDYILYPNSLRAPPSLI
jgi:hypothetical protein